MANSSPLHGQRNIMQTFDERISGCHKRMDLQGKMIDTLSDMLAQIQKDNLTKYAKRYCRWGDRLIYGYPLDSSNIQGTWDVSANYALVEEQENKPIEIFTIFLEKDVEIRNINGIEKAFIKTLK